MLAHKRIIAILAATTLSLCCLAGCGASGDGSASASGGSEASSQTSSQASREEVEAVLDAARANEFTNVTFSMKTESTATAAVNGQTQQQTMESTTKGEINKAADNRGIHMAYTYRTNTELGVTTYDMYINDENLIVTQDEQIYRDELGEGGMDAYIDSVLNVTSKEEIGQLLDVASSIEMKDSDGDTVISITADVDKLADSGLYDASSLPEGTSIATLVASYTIDADNHFKTVRLMSGTNGTPTYRVTQTYRFSDYDATTLPEWPDLKAYIAQQSGVKTDENGRMYVIGDDGIAYYIEDIGTDGTIYFSNDTYGATSGSGNDYYYYDNGYEDTSNDTSTSTGNSSSDQGRAYITGQDGTIHYLDEPGSEIRDLGGSTVFIDADGNWYFLDTGSEG